MTTSFSLRTLSRDDILHHLPGIKRYPGKLRQRRRLGKFLCCPLARTRPPLSGNIPPTAWRPGSASCWRPSTRMKGPSVPCNLLPANRENQPHRADVAKLLVHQNAPSPGDCQRADERARACCPTGRETVLVLDTAAGSGAEQFYVRCGWEKVGEIPRYALMPDGEMTATSLFYKFLP
ncbi:GNAT family acetyltransferase [Klebsiella variicola]|nr:GNAT family acetyltransferase [Klebsiella variicola]